MSVEFEDYSIKVKDAMDEAARQFLEEAAFEVEAQAKRNSRVASGQLKGSWTHMRNTAALEVRIGSHLENAIWEEFGTGEYAANGDGRKGGWRYEDDEGNWHFTMGKKAQHTLHKAFTSKKGAIINRAKQVFGERMS